MHAWLVSVVPGDCVSRDARYPIIASIYTAILLRCDFFSTCSYMQCKTRREFDEFHSLYLSPVLPRRAVQFSVCLGDRGAFVSLPLMLLSIGR